MLYHKGEPLSLNKFEPMRDIYDDKAKVIVLKAGRQISKSTTLCNRMIIRATMIPHYQIVYVVPQRLQATRFSHLYLDSTLQEMVLRKHFLGRGTIQNVLYKKLKNHSAINLTYIGDNKPDRARGIPSDENCYDEVQDLNWDDVLIIDQCLSGSEKYRFRMYSGTPKTMDNTLERLFQTTSQNEWVMKCRHCDKFNVPLPPTVFKMLQHKGLSCAYCGKLIDPREGEWAASNPSLIGEREGYHLPQIIIPRNVFRKEMWEEIIYNYENYPQTQFYNEVLGLSIDLGGRLITEAEILACCTGGSMQGQDHMNLIMSSLVGYKAIIAGVDWCVQGDNESFTVVVILGLTQDNKFQVLYIRKYRGGNHLDDIEDMLFLFTKFGVQLVGADWGAGHINNMLLMEKMPGQIIEYQYATQKNMIQWVEKNQRFIIDRTTALNVLFMGIKKKRFIFPPENEFKPYVPDLLSLREEMSEQTHRKKFVRTRGIPDDFAHALNFAAMTMRKFTDVALI